MIEDVRRVFARTWEAFVSELSRRDPEDEVAGLLGAMRREMVDTRATLPVLQEAIAAAEAELSRERKALADAERRGGMAERGGDAETVRVAGEWAERHRRRVAVLEEKVRATRAEHGLRAAEVEDMMRRYREADANRFTLLSEVRRARRQQRIDQAGGGSGNADFDRAADRIERDIAYGEALDELSGLDDPTPPPPPPTEDLVELRLEEMKRRMGL
jgi:chromosome segregation ATPase